jgi:hypothetical protein
MPTSTNINNQNAMKELGRIGQRRYGGFFYEEFLRELQGRKGIEVYKEMSENDETVGACLYAIEILLKQAAWDVEPASTSNVDMKAADFLKSCLDDMQDSWIDTISEMLSFLPFGWTYHEIVYKRRNGNSGDPRMRSKYDDGLIGWRKLPIRAQETLWEWVYDDEDNLLGMTQVAPPNFYMATIPIEKAIHIKTKSRKNNPEGRSILRNAYRAWYFKRRIQEIEGIGIERDLAGYPVLTTPENMDIWNEDDPEMTKIRLHAERLVQNIRRDALEGLVLPNGWQFQLLSTGGRRSFDTNAIIERYDTRIAMTMLADFILIGHQKVGSFALSSDKTEMFSMAIGAYLDIIAEAFNNQAIPRLFDLNADAFKGMTDYPKLVHGDVETPDLSQLSSFIKEMTGVGIIIPDENLENYIRRVGNLPEKMEDDGAMDRRQKQQDNNMNKPRTNNKDSEEEEDDLEPDNPEEAEMAKRILGRVRARG